MNTTLAIHFGHDFLIAGVEPYPGKFQVIESRGIRKFPLYFYVDRLEGHSDYGWSYRDQVEEGNPGAIGDFYEKIIRGGGIFRQGSYERKYIELLIPLLKDMIDRYANILKDASDVDDAAVYRRAIPMWINFSDDVPKEARSVIRAFLGSQGYVVRIIERNLPELFMENILNGQVNENFAVIEAVGNDLNLSILSPGQTGTTDRIEFKSFSGYGVDPRIGVIAKYVVDNIADKLLLGEKDREPEYKRHLRFAREWKNKLDNTRAKDVFVKTSFLSDPYSIRTATIIRSKIDELTTLYIRQVSNMFRNVAALKGLYPKDIAKIYIIGDTLNNTMVEEEFSRFGRDKLEIHPDDVVYELLQTILAQPEEEAEETTIGEGSQAVEQPRKKPFEERIMSSELGKGEQIEFGWKHSGKPLRKVVAVYEGNNTYTIVSHENSSVVTGDIFVTEGFELNEAAILSNIYQTTAGIRRKAYTTGSKLSNLRKLGKT